MAENLCTKGDIRLDFKSHEAKQVEMIPLVRYLMACLAGLLESHGAAEVLVWKLSPLWHLMPCYSSWPFFLIPLPREYT